MKFILTMLTLAFAAQVSAGGGCQSNNEEKEDAPMLGGNGTGTWNGAASN